MAVFSDGQAKRIGHPRVYHNRGCGACLGSAPWLGLRYEDARVPALAPSTGAVGPNPKFASITAGDVTRDGYPDLWLGDQRVEVCD